MFRLIADHQLRRAERRFIKHYVRCYSLLIRRGTSYEEWSARRTRLCARIEREAARLNRGLA